MFTRLLFSVVRIIIVNTIAKFVSFILKGLACYYLHEKYIACFFFLRIKENSQFYRLKLHSDKKRRCTKSSIIDQKKQSRNQGAGATTETTITTTNTEQRHVRTHARIRKRGRTNNSYNSKKVKENSKQQQVQQLNKENTTAKRWSNLPSVINKKPTNSHYERNKQNSCRC